MRRIVVVGTVLLVIGFFAGKLWQQAPVSAEGQGSGKPKGNGDVNGDGTIDISDGVYVLSWLFTGGPPPKPIECLETQGCALPSTGQTRCCDFLGGEIVCISPDFPGQDGFYKAGCPSEGRFVDNGDGTVTDTCTGLMWQKDTADVSGNGAIADALEDGLNWQDALKYCEGLSFASHDDWRLPNMRELLSIVDYGRFDPAVDPVFGAGPHGYWSSSSFFTFPRAWGVVFHEGIANVFDKDTVPLYVRAVRNAQ